MSLKATGKLWTKKLLMASGGLRFARRLARPAMVILMYHSVLDDPMEHAGTVGVSNTHSTAAFAWQMEYLARNYNPITLQDILEILEGRKAGPQRPVAVTFDDGYVDNLEIAAPVLNRVGIRAAFYLTVECIESGRPPWVTRLRHAFAITGKEQWSPDGQRAWPLSPNSHRKEAFLHACDLCSKMTGAVQDDAIRTIEQELDAEPFVPSRRMMMSWDQARRLALDGHIVGSHTMTHPNMAYVGEKDFIFELAESKRILERELGAPAEHFAYPGPALLPIWTEQTRARCREVGYRTAVITTRGPVYEGDNPLSLRRLGANRQNDEFVWCLENTFLGRSV